MYVVQVTRSVHVCGAGDMISKTDDLVYINMYIHDIRMYLNVYTYINNYIVCLLAVVVVYSVLSWRGYETLD